jgi:hypothetical protein
MLLFLLGLVAGFSAKFLWDYKQAKSLEFSVPEYLGMAAWVIWVACGLTFVIISLGEYEPRAASLGGLIFGVVALAGLVLMRVRYLKSRTGV